MYLVAGLLTFALISSLGIFVQGNQPYVEVNVTCHTNGSVTIVVWNLTDLGYWPNGEEGSWNLNSNGACPPTNFDRVNQQVTYTNVNASLCNTVFSEIGGDIVYEFNINADVADNAPTRTYNHKYNITCKYNADGTVNSSFVPLHEVSDSAEDEEDLTLTLTISPKNNDIPLGHNITATVTVEHPFGEDLDLLLENCTFTSSVSSTGYELILDSCPTDEFNFTTRYNCTKQTSKTEEFVFEAFRFADQDDGDVVVVTCDVLVCLASNATSACQSECGDCDNKIGDRRRRNIPFYDEKVRVTSRKFRIVDPIVEDSNNEEEEEEPVRGSSTDTGLILGVCVGGIAAVAIVCVAVIILTRKRTQSLPVSDTSCPGSYVNQGI